MAGLQQQQKGGVASFLLKLVVFGFFLALIFGGAAVYEFNRRMDSEGPLRETSVLWIQRGDGPSKVAGKLSDMGALDDERLFLLAGRIDKLAPSLQAGEYEIPAGSSVSDIIRLLKDASPLQRFVTVPEGRTTAQVIRILMAEELLTGEISDIPIEGDILPETYAFQRGEGRQNVLDRMVAAHYDVLEELWPNRADDLPFDTKEEAVILASIVEKETSVPDERPRVAAVFVNRMRKGMRLQSDPTIIYGLTGGEPLGRGIRRSEIRKETPYNTYVIRGLPPTPIANPGRASLAAVLNPAMTDDLYFVADGTGGHAFAKTLAEHNANVRRWRQIEAQRKQDNIQ